MSLPTGTWKANVNGTQSPLRIDPLDAQGVSTGQIFGGRIKGFWNEAGQKIQFASFSDIGGGQSPVFGVFEGYLFRSPPQPEPGQDVVVTLVGSLLVTAQAIGSNQLPGIVPSARRSTFGWMAQIDEIQ